MRWVEHYGIGKGSYGKGAPLMYKLGCLMPDWFERNKHHTYSETKEAFIDKVKTCLNELGEHKKDYVLGTIVHYICDYFCTSHDDTYSEYYKHARFEIMSQSYYKGLREMFDDNFGAGGRKVVGHDQISIKSTEQLVKYLEQQIRNMKNEVAEYWTSDWFKSSEISRINIEYSYSVSRIFIWYILKNRLSNAKN